MIKICKLRFEQFQTVGQAPKIKKVLTLPEMAKRYASGELDPKFG
jgi:fructose-bisphosphate aldolase class II